MLLTVSQFTEGSECFSNWGGSHITHGNTVCYRYNCPAPLTGKHVTLQSKVINGMGIREMVVLTDECMAVNNKPCIFPYGETVGGVLKRRYKHIVLDNMLF